MSYRKLGRTSSQRKTMLRDTTTDLVINERIVTTEARARKVRPTIEKMTTLGKRGDPHACRQTATFVRNGVASVCEENESIVIESALRKLFNDLGLRFAERQGDYTHILKTEPRRGGAASVVVIEFVK